MPVPKISLDPAKRNKGEEPIAVSKYFYRFLGTFRFKRCIKHSRIFHRGHRKL